MYTRQIKCRYGLMTILENDLDVSRQLQVYGERMQSEMDFLLRLLDEGSVALDVGAFIGTHTLAFARAVGESGQVYSFEPRPEFFSLLEKNVADNGLTNVELTRGAVSDEPGYVDLEPISVAEPRAFGGVTLNSPSVPGGVTGVRTPIVTIDAMELNRCDLVKVDVEGMELQVLRGGQETIKRARPILYAEVFSVESALRLSAFVHPLAYRTFLHIPRVFNPSNFRGSSVDILGQGHDARDRALVLVPEEKLEANRELLRTGDELIEVLSSDDLVLGLLKNPWYKYEVLANTGAARSVGVQFFANEPELESLKASLRAEVETARAQLQKAQMEGEAARIQLQKAQMEGEAARIQLQRVYASVSWRLMAPLRGVSALLYAPDAAFAHLGRRVARQSLRVVLRHDKLRRFAVRLGSRFPSVQTRVIAMAGPSTLSVVKRARNMSESDILHALSDSAREVYEQLQEAFKDRATHKKQ